VKGQNPAPAKEMALVDQRIASLFSDMSGFEQSHCRVKVVFS